MNFPTGLSSHYLSKGPSCDLPKKLCHEIPDDWIVIETVYETNDRNTCAQAKYLLIKELDEFLVN